MMQVLTDRLKRLPIDYELLAVHVDPGFENPISDALRAYCSKAGYSLRIETTRIGVEAHSSANRENPCFLCSWNRRKRLFQVAKETACNRIALGHHKDDVIETLLMNMCYAGEVNTMAPFQSLFQGRVAIIRPLVFVEEDAINAFSSDMGYPEFHNPCPSAAHSKRSEIKHLLDRLYRGNGMVRGNLFRALRNINRESLGSWKPST